MKYSIIALTVIGFGASPLLTAAQTDVLVIDGTSVGISATTSTDGDPDRAVIQGQVQTEAAGQTDAGIGSSGEDEVRATDNIGSSGEDGVSVDMEADKATPLLFERISAEGSTERAIYIKLGDIKGEVTGEAGTRENAAPSISEITVSGVQVRGWDPKTKQEVQDEAPADAAEVRNETDLAFLVARAGLEDEAIEEVTFNFEKITVKYESRARLFGFISLRLTPTVEVNADGSGEVKVRFPWWHVLAVKDVPADVIADGYTEASDGLNLDTSVQAQAKVFTTLSNVLKATHDTAMNSVRNMK